MKKIADKLYKLANFIKLLADKLKEMSYRNLKEPEMYYVYVPSREKPRYIHFNFKEADKEARRIKRKNQNKDNMDDDVLVLQVVKEYPSEIPF